MAKPLDVDELWTKRILQSVNGLEYGMVQIVVHDGRIVQIERTERKRFESDSASQRLLPEQKHHKRTP
ncbi:YezD family protein [Paenibacillus elgii]